MIRPMCLFGEGSGPADLSCSLGAWDWSSLRLNSSAQVLEAKSVPGVNAQGWAAVSALSTSRQEKIQCA